MKLGNLEFHIVSDGTFRLDGGAMFGVIPRPMWERALPADERNRVTLAMNSLLVRVAGKLVLVETGSGDKWTSKLRDIYAFEGARLIANLAAQGVTPSDIDVVVNTHLHFDHCGWNTRIVDGKPTPTFPNARYVVHRGELEYARRACERDHASYFAETFEPMVESRQWWLLDENTEILPGIEMISMPGHNQNMMGVRLSGGGKSAIFWVDLVPTAAHLALPWIMGYDLYPMTTLENKRRWIPQVIRDGSIALFYHDTKVPAARLRTQGPKTIADPVDVD